MSMTIKAGNVKLKRANVPPTADDGKRILIDQQWPNDVSGTNAHIDQWIKELAPSTVLREWFDHDPARWKEFRSRYATEIRQHPWYLRELRAFAQRNVITLVYSVHGGVHGDAVALRDILLGRHYRRRSKTASGAA